MEGSDNPILLAALAYRKANLSVIPTGVNKRPTLAEWAPFQKRIATEAEIKEHFRPKGRNIAIISGAVSGGLEIIDFDFEAEAFGEWAEQVQEQAPALLEKLIIETSPHGVHIAYRCPETTIPGNTKLARAAVEVDGPGEHLYKGKSVTAVSVNGKFFINPEIIETRGEGGYCLVSPSKGYELRQGDFRKIPEPTAAERDILLEAARACNLWIPPQEIHRAYTGGQKAGPGGKLPGQEFDERGNVREVLERHGWAFKGTGTDGRERWARPGKTKGHSATLTDGKIFYVFSSNAHPFESGKGYGPFRVYALLEHGDDFKAAAKALAAQGYGSRSTRQESNQVGGMGYAELRKKFSEKAEYLWRQRVPKRMPVIISGLPGIGKSSIALAIIKEILEQNPDGMAIWVSTEGQTQDTLIKMGEIGGPLLETSRFQIAYQQNGIFMFNFHRETERKALDKFLGSLPKKVLIVVIDSLRGASENVDENSKIMGDMMNRTQGYVCDKHGACCFWIHHWNKKRNVSDEERLSGNTAIAGAVRAVFDVTGNSEFTRIMKIGKRNLTDICLDKMRVIKTDQGLLFSEEIHTEETDLRRAEKFLIHLFAVQDEYWFSEVDDEGKKIGLSVDVLRKAKKKLPIESFRPENPGPWKWKGFLRGGETVHVPENGVNGKEKSEQNQPGCPDGPDFSTISEMGAHGPDGPDGPDGNGENRASMCNNDNNNDSLHSFCSSKSEFLQEIDDIPPEGVPF